MLLLSRGQKTVPGGKNIFTYFFSGSVFLIWSHCVTSSRISTKQDLLSDCYHGALRLLLCKLPGNKRNLSVINKDKRLHSRCFSNSGYYALKDPFWSDICTAGCCHLGGTVPLICNIRPSYSNIYSLKYKQ